MNPKKKKPLSRILNLFLLLLLQACSVPSCGSLRVPVSDATPPGHEAWTQLLQKHVDEEGMVSYKGFQQDRKILKAYLSRLEENPPNPEKWSKEEQLAYWINLYNAFTIELVLEHYPVSSIKDIGSKIQIPFVNSPWDINFISIKGEKFDLNNIEHNIIREEFQEPRIHFALVCAAISCPKLQQEAYTAEKLDAQLSDQAKAFLANPSKNKFGRNEVVISNLFSWYEGDFTKNGSLIEFLNRYAPEKTAPDADVKYMDYNWSLNEQD